MKEELSWAELPASWAHEHQQPAVAKATGHCAGWQVQWPFTTRCGDCCGVMGGQTMGMDLRVGTWFWGRWWNKEIGRGLYKYMIRMCAEAGARWAKNSGTMLRADLPLLWPSGPRRILHSSICPKDENIILTSFSPYFFETIPMKSFRSSAAAKGEWKHGY